MALNRMRQFKISDRLTPRSTKSASAYLTEVERTYPLTLEEEVEFGTKAMNGDIEARDKLVKANLRFVLSVAKMYTKNPEDYPDLISAGNIGLIEAASRFDPTKGFKFISYAVWHIRKEILEHLGNNSRIVRLPLTQVNVIRKMVGVTNKLSTELGREPTFEEALEALRNSDSRLKGLKASSFKSAMAADIRPASFNAPVTENSKETLLDVFDFGSISPTTDLYNREKRKVILDLVTDLPPTYKEIVMRRHGIPGYSEEEETFQEIAKNVGVSLETVRSRYAKAMRILRRRAASSKKELYEDVILK